MRLELSLARKHPTARTPDVSACHARQPVLLGPFLLLSLFLLFLGPLLSNSIADALAATSRPGARVWTCSAGLGIGTSDVGLLAGSGTRIHH